MIVSYYFVAHTSNSNPEQIMLSKRTPGFIFFLLLSISAFSKSSPFPGYIINLGGDTVHCTVEFGDWNLNPKSVRVLIKQQSREFGPEEIRGFGVEGYTNYITAKVTYHIAKISGGNYPADYPDSTETHTLFLKTLEGGKYGLYSLLNTDRIYYFYRRPGEAPTELLYRFKMNNGILQYDQSYRQQVFNLFETEEITRQYKTRIEKARYNEDDLKYLFSVLNGNRIQAAENMNTSASLQPELFFGGIMNSFPTSFNGDFLIPAQFDPSSTVTGGANLVLSIPGVFKSIRFGLGVGYNGYDINITKSWAKQYVFTGSAYTTKYYESIKAKNSMLFGNVYLMWMINPLDKVRVYIKTGVSYHYSLNQDLDITTSYKSSTDGYQNNNSLSSSAQGANTLLYIKSWYLSFIGSAGVNFGRSSFEIAWWPPSEIVSKSVLTQGSFKVGSIGLFYYYSLTPAK